MSIPTSPDQPQEEPKHPSPSPGERQPTEEELKLQRHCRILKGVLSVFIVLFVCAAVGVGALVYLLHDKEPMRAELPLNITATWEENNILIEKIQQLKLQLNRCQESKSIQIGELNRTLENQNIQIVELNRTLENQNIKIVELHRTPENNIKEIGELNRTLENNIKEIGELDRTLENNIKEIGELNRTLENNIKEIGEQNRTLENNIKEIGELNRTLENNIKEIGELNRTLENNIKEIGELNRTLENKILLLQEQRKISAHLLEQNLLLPSRLLSGYRSFTSKLCQKTSCQCPRCLPGWTPFRSSCFYFSATEKNWQDARDECHEYGGDLGVVSDAEAQAFLRNLTLDFVRQHPESEVDAAWIGLTDMISEGNFRWIDGSKLHENVTFWENPPNNIPSEWDQLDAGQDCVGIHPLNLTGPDWLKIWDDIHCRGKRNYICETEALVI